MKTISIFTDGSCKGNPGPGGWGAIIIYGGKESILNGGSAVTTNNEMELLAVVSSLKHINEIATKPYRVNVYTDSAYVANAINQKWIERWNSNGWMTAKKQSKPSQSVKNKELWIKLYSLLKVKHIKVNVIKVKGHANNEYNNKVDKIACKSAREIQNQINQ